MENSFSMAEGKQNCNVKLSTKKCILYSFNVGIIACLMYGGYLATLGLQNSINKQLGAITAMAVMITYTFTTLFSSLIVKRLGPKCCMIVATTTFAGFQFANIYPHPILLPTAGALLGLACAIIGTAIGSYINALGYEYSRNTGIDANQCISLLQGIYFGLYTGAHLWGYLASSFVLTMTSTHSSDTPVSEQAVSNNIKCGAAFCLSEVDDSSDPEMKRDGFGIGILMNVYMVACLMASIMVMFGMKEIHELGPNIAADFQGSS